jgi:hypothetical protein
MLNQEKDLLNKSVDNKHYCLFYRTKKDLLEMVIPFFKKGLSLNMLCVWVTPAFLGIKETEASLKEAIENFSTYIEKGQFQIMGYKDVYFKSGTFNPNEIMDNWHLMIQRATEDGFSGTYVSGDGSWFQVAGWEDLVNYERQVDAALRHSNTKALCTYPIDNLDLGQTFILSSCHDVALSEKDGIMNILKK